MPATPKGRRDLLSRDQSRCRSSRCRITDSTSACSTKASSSAASPPPAMMHCRARRSGFLINQRSRIRRYPREAQVHGPNVKKGRLRVSSERGGIEVNWDAP